MHAVLKDGGKKRFCPDDVSIPTTEVTNHQEVQQCSSTDEQANIYEYLSDLYPNYFSSFGP